jgi:hypothetical protein
MDMRIPDQAPSERVYRGDHAEDHGILMVTVKIIIVFIIMQFACLCTFSFFFSVDLFIGYFAYGIACSYEQQIKCGTVSAEKRSVFFRNSKNNMSVRNVHTHAFSFDSQFLLVFDTA